MLLLLRFTGHKNIANILSVLTTVAGLTFAVLTTDPHQRRPVHVSEVSPGSPVRG